MTSNEIRKAFVTFFGSKGHKILPSAPMVIKNDPTLMFTNAGMNQFKDIFLGNQQADNQRVTNSQKCLRVSGKHNDLEEVGKDTYHHTMFEMLGNWSFGDYFKKEAINYAWEFLTNILNIDKDRIYATVFGGDKGDKIGADEEAKNYWLQYLPDEHILYGSKKDNFWEMGDTGPCGPCSEIHVDLRDEDERENTPGASLVNHDHPLVIEVWNLVFIQYNRQANETLTSLPMKHVDTGMGFERLCMIIQDKKSNYDTDVFSPLVKEIERLSGLKYHVREDVDIATRVIADHTRAVAFSIADGQLPSNNKAGYVIRRILRRAVRYAYTYLGQEDPFMYRLVDVLTANMGKAYPELQAQQDLIKKVIQEEEVSFLKTLSTGIKLLDELKEKAINEDNKTITGKDAFVLYDTYGFPLDLTELISRESGLKVDTLGFQEEMEKQKNRSKSAAKVETSDWVVLIKNEKEEFTGYDDTETEIKITRYRKVEAKGKELYHLVFNHTPFYAESGGQIGDSGTLHQNGETIKILNTIKENNLHIHIANKLPLHPDKSFTAKVNPIRRSDTAANHTATHLLHHALKKVLGPHVEQKGSLVHPDYLRFDFSHFQKVTDKEIENIESIVNGKIRENIPLQESRSVPMEKAREMGAVALFGEKYGDNPRVIQFDESIELCGGTHVLATGEIGLFKIISESAIAAGIRRIEALTGQKSYDFVNEKIQQVHQMGQLLKNPREIVKATQQLIEENAILKKQIETFEKEKVGEIKSNLANKRTDINGINFIGEVLDVDNAGILKDLAFQVKDKVDNLFMIVGAEINGKANLSIMISNGLVEQKKLHAGSIIKDVAKNIQGGGGGQPFFATAGGKNPSGLQDAINQARNIVENLE